jgi:hypothetical protein
MGRLVGSVSSNAEGKKKSSNFMEFFSIHGIYMENRLEPRG